MVNYIDISRITNCWIGQLSPGGADKDNKDFKNECKDNKFYRIGWTINQEKFFNAFIDQIYLFNEKNNKNIDMYFSKEYERKEFFLKEENKNKKDSDFEEEYKNKKKNTSLDNALKSMYAMKENDLIITRITGKYYIGRIKSKKAQYLKQQIKEKIDYRWSVEVYEWIEIPEKDMPGDIIGRFSQRRHPTIQRISETEDSMRLKLLIIKIFQENQANEHKFDNLCIPQIILNKNNFTSSLNYMNLEDLVYLYIIDKNAGYQLLPSACKISKVNYEMDLINLENKRITCQVKNKEPVKYEEYIDDANEKIFEKIYLFSGIEEYDNEEIRKKLEEEKEDDIILKENIIIIRKENLFKFFHDNDIVKILKKEINIEKYYKFKDEKEIPKPEGWNIWLGKDNNKDKYRLFIPGHKNSKFYMENIYGNIIFPNNVIYYSSEWNSLIQYKECNNNQFINDIKRAYGIEL